ncbi:tRNA (uridine(54)-C5)-methyltransferase TrmA [uncultured Helicobacter sp.]|uniref:tRNA (uridine(54)-C5)-methyltransferase TrmA n=1 Tax=uncultured Helicobacter sp. TaxID=175537 RepID=UPI00374E3E04
MVCAHFGICGGCRAYEHYDFAAQARQVAEMLLTHDKNKSHEITPLLFTSPQQGFRARADFRFCTYEGFYFATNAFGKNERTKITHCPILLEPIQILIHHIREIFAPLADSHPLRHKLYGCSFLSTYQTCIITLIYHKRLESHSADSLSILRDRLTEILQAHYLGFEIILIRRAKGEKVVYGTSQNSHIPSDCIMDNFSTYLDAARRDSLQASGIDLHKCTIFKKESLFSQPNPFINAKMLDFLLTTLPRLIPNIAQSDLLELYCGSGNFTIVLSQIFRRVFATEVVKDSIHTLQSTLAHHVITNITLARLNAEESISALLAQREFFRLKNVDLNSFRFGAILIDPPRSGVGDEAMLEFIARFPLIVYISCAPQTLHNDLKVLRRTHRIHTLALFEQFPYTHHIESICILTR